MACHRIVRALMTLALAASSLEGTSAQERDTQPAEVEPVGIPIRFRGYLPGTINDELKGTFQIEFRIYRSPQGGEPVWREEQEVEVVNGRIDVEVGREKAIPMEIHESTFKWLGASVNGSREVYPRYHVVNVVYVSAKEGLVARSREGNVGVARENGGAASTVALQTEPAATWREALDRARAAGADLPDNDQWYAALRSCPMDALRARTEHYEWVLPWAYDTASHGRENLYFRGRFQGCDYMDLSPEKRYPYRLARLPGIASAAGAARTSTARARAWLLARQAKDGGFHAGKKPGVPTEALTAMALWALCVDDSTLSEPALADSCDRAVRFLIARQQEDGGVYRPASGLSHTTSAVVRQALRAWSARTSTIPPDHAAAIVRLDAYLAGGRKTESWTPTPSASAIADLAAALERESEVSEESRRALAFLRRVDQGADLAGPAVGSRRTDGFGYDQLLGMLGNELRLGDPILAQARARLKELYTLERNPDLTLRYGPGGFSARESGYYYYLLTIARVLGASGEPRFETTDGVSHPWAEELESRLTQLQRADGSWINANGRWWEDEPVLVTSYALLCLERCRRCTTEQR